MTLRGRTASFEDGGGCVVPDDAPCLQYQKLKRIFIIPYELKRRGALSSITLNYKHLYLHQIVFTGREFAEESGGVVYLLTPR
jgi:hypothetical protein